MPISKLDQARRYVAEQRRWIDQCGGNLAGYIARYGSAKDPCHTGDGAEAIYAADTAELERLEAQVRGLERATVAGKAKARNEAAREARSADKLGVIGQ